MSHDIVGKVLTIICYRKLYSFLVKIQFLTFLWHISRERERQRQRETETQREREGITKSKHVLVWNFYCKFSLISRLARSA